MYPSRFLMPCLIAAALGLYPLAFSGTDPETVAPPSQAVGRFNASNAKDYEDPIDPFRQPTPGQIKRAMVHACPGGQMFAHTPSAEPCSSNPLGALSPHPSRKTTSSTGSTTPTHARHPSLAPQPSSKEDKS